VSPEARKVVERIYQAGGRISEAAAGGRVFIAPADVPLEGTALRVELLQGSQATDQDVARLSCLPQIEVLALGATMVTDESLRSVAQWKNLQFLMIFASAKVTADGLARLEGQPSLSDLGLSHRPVGEAELAHLVKIPKLRVLNLYQSGITDEWIARLVEQRPDLTSLQIGGNKDLTDRALESIGRCTSLSVLHLSGAQISDAGLSHLGACQKLKHLFLDNTAITDGGLTHLARLKNLKEIRLGSTKVTEAGVAKIQAALPNCKVTR